MGVLLSSASEALAEQVSIPVLVFPFAEMLAVTVGSVLSTVTVVLFEIVSPWSSVATTVQVIVSPGVVLVVSCRVLLVEL